MFRKYLTCNMQEKESTPAVGTDGNIQLPGNCLAETRQIFRSVPAAGVKFL
jgi:hypothetical protein